MIARQVAAGLQKAHAQGVLHRDIKPANIMMTNDGPAVIMDFGLAKRSDATFKTRTGTLMGTVAYMSPEQVRGAKVDHRADLWALGVMMYEMLTGKRPFTGDIDPAVIYAITNANPDPIGPQCKGVPAALEEIVERLLEKDPNRRFADAGALLEALDDTGLVSSTGSIRTVRLQRWQRRRLGWALAGVIPLVALVMVGLFVWPGFLNPKEAISSLAVLPLVERAAGEDETYFAQGITDELITGLMKTGAGLTVVSRSSAEQASQKYGDITETARHLGVDAVIEGTVTRNGDQVRVSAQLVLAKNSKVIWADSYEHSLQNIFSIQREIAQAVSRAIEAELTPLGQTDPAAVRTVNPEAYETVLRGRFHRDKFTPEGIDKSIELYKKAIDIDPGYGDPYAELALSYMISSVFGGAGDLEGDQKYQLFQACMDSALTLGADLGGVYSIQATMAKYFEWDWDKARRLFKQAIEQDPGRSDAWQEQAGLFFILGEKEQAIASAQRAKRLNPLGVMTVIDLARIYYLTEHYEEAEAEYEAAREIDPDYHLLDPLQGELAIARGDYERAIDLLSAGDQEEPGPALGLAYALAGQRSKAEEILELNLKKPIGSVDPVYLAQLHEALGQTETALDQIEAAYLGRHAYLPQEIRGPQLANLRDHPRVKTIIQEMGLPAE
jgi:TolB-like protein